MLHIKLKEMEHRIPCLPAYGEFCGLLMVIFAISLTPGQNFRDFFFIFSLPGALHTYDHILDPDYIFLNPGKAQQKVQLDLDSSCLQNFIQLPDMTPKRITTMLLHT